MGDRQASVSSATARASARWPGDAHSFAKIFAGMLKSQRKPDRAVISPINSETLLELDHLPFSVRQRCRIAIEISNAAIVQLEFIEK